MRIFTQTHPTPIGITGKAAIAIPLPIPMPLSTPFTAYQKPRSPNKTSRKKLPKKTRQDKPFTEKDFAKVNLAQQLLLMQALWLGKNKDAILQSLFHKNMEVITFVHWLAVPSLGVVLSFSHQNCVKIEWL